MSSGRHHLVKVESKGAILMSHLISTKLQNPYIFVFFTLILCPMYTHNITQNPLHDANELFSDSPYQQKTHLTLTYAPTYNKGYLQTTRDHQ